MDSITLRGVIPWIASPIDDRGHNTPHLRRRSEASAIELFYDLFLVGNLSTFTATHEINNLNALWAYVGFLGIVWFTWFQVTLYDVRFARDSIFERTCKAVQLAVMVGFASAGPRFTTRIHDENAWAFRALSILLAGSRFMLALQYSISLCFIRKAMRETKGVLYAIICVLIGTATIYIGMYYAFGHSDPRIWMVWFALFGLETLSIMSLSDLVPGLGFEDTHLNVRMALLTLIIMGEGVILLARTVNKIVGGGGWTQWSFVHILGVTSTVYLLWQSYHDISPRKALGRLSQQIWVQLHFPLHAVLILASEGSQILALTLDVALKLKYLGETIIFSCEEPRPSSESAIRLLQSTISDMEIDYARGALGEKDSIDFIINSLWNQSNLCSSSTTTNNTDYALTPATVKRLMGNVTVALFSSMGITPAQGDLSRFSSKRLLRMYIQLLGFVYAYYFVVVSLTLIHFAVFTMLAGRFHRRLHTAIAVGARLLIAIMLMALVSLTKNFNLTYNFMTSPIIIFTFALALFSVLVIDRFIDWMALRKIDRSSRRNSSHLIPMITVSPTTCPHPVSISRERTSSGNEMTSL